jgi:hypothetical protein
MEPDIEDGTEATGFMSRMEQVETPCVKGGTHPIILGKIRRSIGAPARL